MSLVVVPRGTETCSMDPTRQTKPESNGNRLRQNIQSGRQSVSELPRWEEQTSVRIHRGAEYEQHCLTFRIGAPQQLQVFKNERFASSIGPYFFGTVVIKSSNGKRTLDLSVPVPLPTSPLPVRVPYLVCLKILLTQRTTHSAVFSLVKWEW